MSNFMNKLEQDCETSKGCNAIKLILTPKDKELGGFSVRRSLPTVKCKSVGPWIFFDHMGPAHFEAGQGIDVRPHPHIGLATVTYLFTGEMLHRDSLGNEQIIRPGEVNLMLAGKGIVHSERQRAEIKTAPQDIHGLQLWLALPKEFEQVEPGFYHYDSVEIPEININGIQIRVMIGSAYELTSPVKTLSETLYVEARLKAGQTLTLPKAEEKAVYIVSGSLTIGDTQLPANNMAVLNQTQGVTLTANKDSMIVIVGGASLGPRFVEWNFVASDKSLLEQAKSDWKAGRFSKVPGDDKEFIPLPE